MNTTQFEKIGTGRGFFAALDQSGGSTPKALAEYGIERDRYSSDAEMFDLVHAMRTRVLTSPAFDGSRVLAAILFEQTMERDVNGVPTARYLWDEKNVVPFLKVDKGLAPEQDGVQLMKPIDTLDDLLERANRHQIFGTKMRSVINDANEAGISAIVDQQFEYAARIGAAGLVPIIEPEVSISSPHKEQAETMLRDAIAKRVEALPEGAIVMLKITIPTQPGLYGELASDPRVLRIVALSGGYSRDEACALLARDPTLIASFSRALLEGLTEGQTDEEFNAQLEASIEQIYHASVNKQPLPAGNSFACREDGAGRVCQHGPRASRSRRSRSADRSAQGQRFWNRPLHAMTDAFTVAGFRISVISEPHPVPEARELFPDELAAKPSFLCFLFFVLHAD